jgi:AcrR family transcriptional regulator
MDTSGQHGFVQNLPTWQNLTGVSLVALAEAVNGVFHGCCEPLSSPAASRGEGEVADVPRGLRPTLTERRAIELRTAIALTAMELFVADGDTSATIERICTTAGVSPRTFHRHFPAKEDVVRPLFRASSDEVIAALENAPADGDPIETLVHAWTSLLDGSRLSAFDRRFLSLMVTTPEYHLRWMETDDELCEAVTQFLHRHTPPNGHALLRALPAYLVVQSTRYVFEHWITSGSDEDIAELLREAFRMVLSGARVR